MNSRSHLQERHVQIIPMENEILYRRAAARVAMQRAFHRHVIIYVVVNLLLAAVNLLTNPHHLWFQWGLLGWGIGLLAHGLNVYSHRWFGSRREQMIQRQRQNLPQS